MSYEDRTLTCRDCGAQFTFTTGEQEFYAVKGFTNDPSRCNECRSAKKQSFGDRKPKSRELYSTTCSECGKEAKVPFVPSGDKPVYCSDCFRAKAPAPSRW